MPKKEERVTIKSILSNLVENSVQPLISAIVSEAEQLAGWIKDLSGVGKKIRNLLTTVILFSAGMGVFGIGIALYINELFPNLRGGSSHIFVGLTFILIAALYTKYNK